MATLVVLKHLGYSDLGVSESAVNALMT